MKTKDALISKSILRNSTCFGQFLCSSTGAFHCKFGTDTCYTGLTIACLQDQDGTAVPSWSCQWKPPDDRQRNCSKLIELRIRIDLKISSSVGFIVKKFVTMHGHINVKPTFLSRQLRDGNTFDVFTTDVAFSWKEFLEAGKQMKMQGTKSRMCEGSSRFPRQTFSSKFQVCFAVGHCHEYNHTIRTKIRTITPFDLSGQVQPSRVQAVVNYASALQEVRQQHTQKTVASSLPADRATEKPIHNRMPCPWRANAAPIPLPCHAVPLIHTCHAAPLPCSDSAVSFAKFRVVAGNIWTASLTV